MDTLIDQNVKVLYIEPIAPNDPDVVEFVPASKFNIETNNVEIIYRPIEENISLSINIASDDLNKDIDLDFFDKEVINSNEEFLLENETTDVAEIISNEVPSRAFRETSTEKGVMLENKNVVEKGTEEISSTSQLTTNTDKDYIPEDIEN
ncbi:uncharacterized protein LOC115875943 [Sitophilus oryzae]|uniref:Uncharacterized protein LOC115875943 n=1 Tax=Sitophilus oryzae TaxID=7048 RepID=A0A6J2X8A1_SITOR|nr:uncharacterized protein LOC115875943 [Sitophilus oryzae]